MMGTTPYGPEFNFDSPNRPGVQMPFMQEQTQSLPVGAGGDCGCGAPNPAGMPENFVPPTPPIYSAPFMGSDAVQPPFMNPYGMGPVGTSSYGMPGNHDESS